MTSVEVSRCTPGRTKLASMRGLVPLRQEGACGGLASLASSPPCWQLGPRAAVGALSSDSARVVAECDRWPVC
jgi:hypothetical protein